MEPETSPQNIDSQARSRKDSTISKSSSGSGAPGEREIVAALSEHAQKIAEQVLSRPETGQDLLQDAQVRHAVFSKQLIVNVLMSVHSI